MNTTMFHSTQNTSRVSTPQPARSRRRFATVARTTASGTPSTGSSVAPSTTTDSLAVASQAPQSASTGRPVNPYRVSLWGKQALPSIMCTMKLSTRSPCVALMLHGAHLTVALHASAAWPACMACSKQWAAPGTGLHKVMIKRVLIGVAM